MRRSESPSRTSHVFGARFSLASGATQPSASRDGASELTIGDDDPSPHAAAQIATMTRSSALTLSSSSGSAVSFGSLPQFVAERAHVVRPRADAGAVVQRRLRAAGVADRDPRARDAQ